MSEEKRVAVGGRSRCGTGADVPATPASVIDDDLLAEGGRQFFAHDTRHRVDAAAGRVRHDQRYRVGVILSSCCAANTNREQASNEPGTHTPKGVSERFPLAADA